MTDLTALGIADLSTAYARGDTGPVAVTEALLARIERLEPTIGSFQAVYADTALAAAKAAEASLGAGHRIGPFHGVPFALKDIIDVEGLVTTNGSKAMENRISPETATVARRLIAAGGILMGKVKTVECAVGGWGTNQLMGTPRNPWDMKTPRTPGGSSSGSGVSVAASLVPCAVGTDTGGSVRLPAAWCGVTGLKLTEGILPTDGIMPLSHTLDTPGPLARSVLDAVLMYEVMAGVEGHVMDAAWASGHGLYGAMAKSVDGLTIGILSDEERAFVTPDLLALYDAALARLSDMGAVLVQLVLPTSFDAMTDTIGRIVAVEGVFHHGAIFGDPNAPVDEDVRPRIMAGQNVPASHYVGSLRKRLDDQVAFAAANAGIDAYVTPTTMTPPLPLSEVDQTTTPAHFTRPANYLALCGIALPMGVTEAGMPGSLQVIAHGHHEAMALRIAAAYERDRGPAPLPEL